MRFKSIILAVGLLSGNSYAVQDWLEITSTDAGIWEGRAGTREYATTRGGLPIVVANGRVRWIKDKSIDLVRWYVTVQDCKKGYGKVVTLDMSGNFRWENDYVKNGGTVASAIGEMLCYPVDQQTLKGI